MIKIGYHISTCGNFIIDIKRKEQVSRGFIRLMNIIVHDLRSTICI